MYDHRKSKEYWRIIDSLNGYASLCFSRVFFQHNQADAQTNPSGLYSLQGQSPMWAILFLARSLFQVPIAPTAKKNDQS